MTPTSRHPVCRTLLVCALLLLCSFFQQAITAQNLRPGSRAAELAARLQNLPAGELTRFRTILAETGKGPGGPTTAIQKEFLSLLTSVAPTRADAAAVQDLVLARTEYRLLLLQDGLASLKAGKLLRSLERETYEQRLEALGVLTDAQVTQGQQTVERITRREPVTNARGQTATLDEAALQNAISQLTQAKGRVDLLFPKQ